jgi:hypothetical protein
MIIPTFADSASAWVNCSVGADSKVTITWGGTPTTTRLQIIKNDGKDAGLFKEFKNGIPGSGSFSFIETREGTYSYKVIAYDTSGILLASNQFTVTGTGKPVIKLEFRNSYSPGEYISVERIKNFVNIYNFSSEDLDLSQIKIKYFYTIDGEPAAAKNDPNNGQEKIEESDGKIDPDPVYTEYPDGNRSKQVKPSIRIKFKRMPVIVKNESGVPVADYYSITYFDSTNDKIDSASYLLMLQPAFHKINLTNDEANSAYSTYIRNYDLTNDYSFNNSENIAVYYENELIWGNDPSIITPSGLTAKFDVSQVNLNWNAIPGADGYNIYRSEKKDGTYTRINSIDAVDKDTKKDITTYSDNTIESPSPYNYNGKDYYYKIQAVYDGIKVDGVYEGIKSNYSNIAKATVYTFVITDAWDITYHIINNSRKSNVTFGLGSYIPVSMEAKLKRTTNKPNILIDVELKKENTDLNNLTANLISSNTGGFKLLKSSVEASKVIIGGNLISFNNRFVVSDDDPAIDNRRIKIEFVLKASSDSNLLNTGIKNYYGYFFDFNLTFSGFQPGSNAEPTDMMLPVKIVKSTLK